MEQNKELSTKKQCDIHVVSGCSYPKIILHLCADLGSDSLFYLMNTK